MFCADSALKTDGFCAKTDGCSTKLDGFCLNLGPFCADGSGVGGQAAKGSARGAGGHLQCTWRRDAKSAVRCCAKSDGAIVIKMDLIVRMMDLIVRMMDCVLKMMLKMIYLIETIMNLMGRRCGLLSALLPDGGGEEHLKNKLCSKTRNSVFKNEEFCI